MRGQPLLSQVFLEIGETDRLKLFAQSAGDVVRTGAAHERCHVVRNRAAGGVAGKSAAMMGEPQRGRGAVRGPHARPPRSDETLGKFLPALPTSPLALSPCLSSLVPRASHLVSQLLVYRASCASLFLDYRTSLSHTLSWAHPPPPTRLACHI